MGPSHWGLGPALAFIALFIQIAVAPVLHQRVSTRFADEAAAVSPDLDPHALCLAGDRDASKNPTDQAPKPVHHNHALCCCWHGNAALAPVSDTKRELVAYALLHSAVTPDTLPVARRLTGTVGARAPPIQA